MNQYETVKNQIGPFYVEMVKNCFKCNYLEAKQKYTRQERIDKIYEIVKKVFPQCHEVDIKMALFILDSTLETFNVDGETYLGNHDDYIEEIRKDVAPKKGKSNECIVVLNNGKMLQIEW